MYELHLYFVAELHKSNLTFTRPPAYFGSGNYSLIYIYHVFLSTQLLKELTKPFDLTYSLSPFLLITFSTLSFLLFYLQFFFIKPSNDFFAFKITNHICPRHSIFNFFNYKNVFGPIWNMAFCKNILIF